MEAQWTPGPASRSAPARIFHIIRDTIIAWLKDGAPSMGAAIAFYTLFATAPILLLVIRAAGMFVAPEVVQEHVLLQLHRVLGNAGYPAVRTLISGLAADASGGLSTAAGVITLLFGASSVFAELQNALNRIWRSEPRGGTQGLRHAVRARLLSFALVFVAGFLLMLLLVASSGLAMLTAWLDTMNAESHRVVWLLDVALGFGLATLLFAMIFRFVPQRHVSWRAVWVGSFVTAALFSLGRVVIVVYLGRTALHSLYGFAGSFLLLLLWVYYSAQIFLLGAEFTCRYAHERDGVQRPASEGR
jgi:membrane protein